MKWRLKASTLVIASLLATPAFAQSFGQEDSGWYSQLLGGIAFGGASNIQAQGTEIPNTIDLGKKTGWALSGAGGYDWGLFRTELEASMRRNAADGDGSYKAYGLMANLLADLPLNEKGVSLYFGGGIGVARLVFDGINSPHAPFDVTGEDNGFAYQFIGGLRIPITEHVFGQVDYRFFNPNHPSLTDSFGRNVKGNYSSHTVMAGISVLFGGAKAEAAPPPPPPQPAPPPPPPAPAPEPEAAPAPKAPAGPFLIFFDFDSTVITPEAHEILSQAVDSFKQLGRASIQVAGYADRAGATAYNQRLSERRAQAAAQVLKELGVDTTKITTQAFGEAMPLVPTPDGVREPQNRRAEITLGE